MRMADLDLLIPQKPEEPLLRPLWATVTQASPLRIRFDGEASALAVPVVDLVGGLVLNDRVWVVLSAGQVYVVGRNGGRALPTPTTVTETGSGSTGSLRVGNTLTQRGVVALATSGSATASATVTFPIAFTGAPNVQLTGTGNGFTGYATSIGLTTFVANMEHVNQASSSVSRTWHWMATGTVT